MAKQETPQEVIKVFMQTLSESSLTAKAAMNAAIKACSDFTSMQDAINHFLSDAKSASSGTAFLKDYCGIILGNDDTGAITGSDAGGSTVKTAKSVVPESGSSKYPTGTSFTKNGLTVIIPQKSTLTTAQQTIVRGLYSWWIEGALNLNEESYNLGFDYEGVTVDEITLKFEDDEESGALAYVSSYLNEETGITDELELVVNMAFYGNISTSDVNGESSSEDAGYLDRTLAHEMTHAVMAANISTYNNLPIFVLEGLAELTHGIDDERLDEIQELADNPTQLTKYLNVNRVNTESDTPDYSGGYMFFRYLAKQGSESDDEDEMPEGLTYNSTFTALTADSTFTESEIDLSDYESTVKTVDASKVKVAVNIVGNSLTNTLKGGSKADTISGGVGNDYISGGAGNDSLSGGNGSDKLFGEAGNDTMRGGDGNDYLSGGVGADKLFGDAGADTLYGGAGNDYLNGGGGADKVFGDAGNDTIYGGAGNDYLSGGAGNDKLFGDVGNDTLIGGKGNDTLTGGAGKNVFIFATGDGNDIITDYKATDKIQISGSYSTLNSGQNVIIKVGTGQITLQNAKGKKLNITKTTTAKSFVEDAWFIADDNFSSDDTFSDVINSISEKKSDILATNYEAAEKFANFKLKSEISLTNSKNKI